MEGESASQSKDEQIQMLELALQESEGKIMQAALFGKKLLEKTQELEAMNSGLREENRLLSEQLQAVVAREQQTEAWRAAAPVVATGQGNEELQAAIAELQRRNDSLHNQIVDASRSNDRLAEELKRKEEELSRSMQQLKHANSVAEEATRVAQSRESELEILRQKHQQQQQQQGSAVKSKAVEQEKEELVQQLEVWRSRLARADEEKERREKAFREQQEELEKTKAGMAELLATKHSMEEAVASLVRQTQQLRNENEEQVSFLAQARETIGQLKKEREAALAAGGASGGGAGMGVGGTTSSLLDELEANVDSKLKEQQAKPARPAVMADGAPENCEEYFLIAQTAVKIGLAMKFPHKSDEVFKVRGIDLYYKCLNAHVPFHQWHLWISRTLHAMIKGDVKPAAIMENKKLEGGNNNNDNNQGGGAAGGGGGAAGGGKLQKAKGWLGSLFN